MLEEDYDELERALRPRRIIQDEVHPTDKEKEEEKQPEVRKSALYFFPVFSREWTEPRWRLGKAVKWNDSIINREKDAELRGKHGLGTAVRGVENPISHRRKKKKVSMAAAWLDAAQSAAQHLHKLEVNDNEKNDRPQDFVIHYGRKSVKCQVDIDLERLKLDRRIVLKKLDGTSFLTAFYPSPARTFETTALIQAYKKKPLIEVVNEEELVPSSSKPPLPLIRIHRTKMPSRRRLLSTARRAVPSLRGEGENAVLHLLQKLKQLVLAKPNQPILESFFIARLQASKTRVGVGYFGPQSGGFTRMVVVIIEMPRNDVDAGSKIGCVRFVTDVCNIGNVCIQLSDVEIQCSCRSIMAERCVHQDLCVNNGVIASCVMDLLSLKVPACSSITENRWRSIVLGNREASTSCIWLVRNVGAKGLSTQICVPVTEVRQQGRLSQSIEKRLRCQGCRRLAANRGYCEHEIAVAEKVKESNRHNSKSVSDMDFEINDCRTNEPVAAMLQDESDYVSKLPRNVFACPMDKASLESLTVKIVSAFQRQSEMKQTSGVEGEQIIYVAFDEFRECRECGTVVHCDGDQDSCVAEKREALLHTLTHGSIKAGCNEILRFDGRECALFAASTKSAVYTREILDFWLYEVAMLGSTFRAAYESSKLLSRTTSIVQRRLGQELSCNRRQASNVFSAFLQTLTYPRENVVAPLFNCSKCEVVDSDGRKSMRAIVMDGTATGILGELPKFDRPSIIVEGAKNTAKEQFLLQSSSLRGYLDYFLLSSKTGVQSAVFEVKPPQVQVSDSLHKLLTDNDAAMNSVTLAVQNLLRKAFDLGSFINLIHPVRRRRQNRETSARVSHLMPCIVTRGAFLDFMRSVICASLPCAFLSSTTKVQAAKALQVLLYEFSTCTHGSPLWSGQSRACKPCALKLGREACKLEPIIPTASNLAMCVAESEMSGRFLQSMSFSHHMSSLLKNCLSKIHSFNELFFQVQSDSAKRYTELHTSGSSVPDDADNRGAIPVCDSEAGRTGDLYPGRPLVRPRVSFGNTRSGSEKLEECNKDYRKAPSHTPGLFTVQCTCHHPKLLGVTVMSANESVSTALTAVLSRFGKLPSIVFYDNACNLTASTNLRLPWVKDRTLFLCDRFHYRTHKCSSVFDPDTYRMCDELSTSGAEALNKQFAASRRHIRFLAGKNLVPFIYVRSLFLNIRAHLRDQYQQADVEDSDLVAFANDKIPCECRRCALWKET